MEKLKPCPFCGSEAEINGRDRLHYWFVQCIECGATQYGKETKEETIETWNRRAERERRMSDDKKLIGKTIVWAEINGFGVELIFSDGSVFDYSSSDGGYSCWEIIDDTKQAERSEDGET